MPNDTNNTAGSDCQERLVRPLWVETCSCIRVAVNVSDRRPNETEEGYKARWADTVQSAYERGADWNYDADCPLCDCGTIRRTNRVLNEPDSD